MGESVKFETVIGIEVHAQLKTKTKLFCGCSTQFGQKPNTNVCPVCLGMPGALPVLNKRAVEMAMMIGFALDCQVKPLSVFSRKNYFYPDLPKGYQISQFDLPICEHGHLDISLEGDDKRIGITRIHMEEDAGKLLHQGADGIAGATHSLVDLNRACTPLVEIVSEPDLRSAAEARAYMEKLQQIVKHIGICDGNLEEGSMRADANVSIRPVGQKEFGTRTEIKNLNSFRSLERAINGEVARQKKVILSGGTIDQETRNYDDNSQTTTVLRSKEDAHDYRYFPEPDLPPLVLSQEWMDDIKATLPELPDAKVQRYQADYGLSDFECKVLISDIDMDGFFRQCIEKGSGIDIKEVAKWVVGDMNAFLKEGDDSYASVKVLPEQLVEMVSLIKDGTISGKMAKEILPKMISSGESAKVLVEKMGGGQISDESEIEAIVQTVLDENPDVVEKIKNGKKQAAGFLVGQVMKASKGKAKPDLVNKIIFSKIS